MVKVTVELIGFHLLQYLIVLRIFGESDYKIGDELP